MKGWTNLLVGGMIAGIIGCGSDSAGPTLTGVPAATRGTTPGTDTTRTGTDTSHTGPGTTSNGPIASFAIVPHVLVLPMGYYGSLAVSALDAKGIRVAAKITWRSSNAAVAIASDTGVVYGKALGTATVYASVDGFIDSATVTVIPTPATPTTPTAPAPVSQFSLKVVALGAIVGADTSHAERVAGAAVTIVRTGGISGDTLATPETLGTGTTDANGEAKFTQLPGGFYTIRVVPPIGSPYTASQTSIIPPRYADIFVTVTMRRP